MKNKLRSKTLKKSSPKQHKVDRDISENKRELFESIDIRFLEKITPLKNLKNDKKTPFKLGEINFDLNTKSYDKIKYIRKKYKITNYYFSKIIFGITLHTYTQQRNFFLAYKSIKEENEVNLFPFEIEPDFNFIDIIKNTNKLISSNKLIPMEKEKFSSILFSHSHNKKVLKSNLKSKIYNPPKSHIIIKFKEENEIIYFEVNYNKNKIDKLFLNLFLEKYKIIFETTIQSLELYNKKNTLKTSREYSTLSKKEYKKILYNWNNNNINYPSHATIHSFFQLQVKKTPNNIALICDKKEITYKELNEKSNQIANYLTKKYTINPDTLIALYLERNEYTIITILAVLKTGGGYVPIDPNFPKERVKFIINETQTKIILTNNIHKKTLLECIHQGEDKGDFSLNDSYLHSPKVLTIDSKTLQQEFSYQKNTNPICSAESHHLAYVIYTSGTTGTPKGIMIEHKGVVNLALHVGKTLGLLNSKKIKNWFNFANYIFDAHILEYTTCLFFGHTLHITNNKIRQNINLLDEYIKQKKIHITLISPVVLEKNRLSNLDILMFGGDKINENILKNLLENKIKVVNSYGPTETTIMSHGHIYTKDSCVNNIGKAIANTKSYILDKNLNPLPIGAIGELYIGGEGVARGYLNRVKLTQDVFIKNPYQTKEEIKSNCNRRIYKTGDLVKWLPNGEIEFIGRNDFQIKIRGLRVELSEIETILSNFQNIKMSLVIVNSNSETEKSSEEHKYLLAYYTADEKYDEKEITNYLKTYLPDYMIPNVFLYLEKFPLTHNGKIDRNSLPIFDLTDKKKYIAPKSDLQKEICQCWADILKLPIEKIGIEDDFIKLGGNSILAIKLSNLINRRLNCDISISKIFINKDISNLSDIIKNNQVQKKKIKIQNENEKLLSYAQERLWFIEKYNEGSHFYNIPLVFEISTSINLSALQQAMRKVYSRHYILRTLIKENSSGRAYQTVLNNKEFPLKMNSKYLISKNDLEKELNSEINHIYDLSNEVPIRVCFYNLEEKNKKKNYLSIVVHHIAFDGWSVEILIHELEEFYKVFDCQDENKTINTKLQDISFQYKDFALWQREYLNRDVFDNQINYWKRKLEGFETLNLATDKVRPSKINYAGKNIYFNIDTLTSKNLRELAQECQVSIFTLLLSGFFLLLKCFSGQNDITIGIPFSNRHYDQVENLIGFFVNSLPIRIVNITTEKSLKDFIKTVGNEILEIQEHQDMPFEKIVDELLKNRDTSRHPIFQVMFSIQNFASHLKIQGKKKKNLNNLIEFYSSESDLYSPAKFDLNLSIDDSNEKIKGYFNYAVSLFNTETINNYISTYVEILNQFSLSYINKNNTKINELKYLSNKDFKKIVLEWNKTKVPLDNNKTIHSLFEKQVLKTPNNIALIYNKKRIIYSELNEKSNQLAQYLIKYHKIKPDTFIALYLERNEHMLIAILAVLKAGAAYVPIDPDVPQERVKFILEDCKIKVILLNESHQEKLSNLKKNHKDNDFSQLNIISIDSNIVLENLKIQKKKNPITKTKCHNIAYIIYTSGTTGKPKGVLIEHKSVVNLILSEGRDLGLTDSKNIKNWFYFANYIFDAHVFEYSICLLFGHTLHITDNEIRKNINLLDEYFSQNNINITLLPPIILENNKLKGLETLIFGGDKINKNILDNFLENGIKMVNAYGPSEITVMSHKHICSIHSKANNIGKAIANTKNYVLDSNLNPVPIGAIGELFLGGIGLARGYLNRTELNSEKFLRNPFQTQKEKDLNNNSRIYKTGDIVRWLGNGELEYIGRSDFQVKIRGHRVELGEIENAMLKIEGILQSHVIVKSLVDPSNRITDQKFLVAYYSANAEMKDTKIIDFLNANLPDYMIPNCFMHLKKIPMTANGKIESKALPEPQIFTKENYFEPRNEIEHKICQIWAETLSLPQSQIGIQDSFFKVGGNSILAIRLVNKINTIFSSHIKLADVFVCKNIKELVVRVNQTKGHYQAIVKLNNTYDKKNLFMIHPATTGCEVYASLANHMSNEFSCYGVDSYNMQNSKKIGSLNELSKYYLHEIEKIMLATQQESYHLIGWSLGGYIALEIASLLENRNVENVNVYLLDTTVINSEVSHYMMGMATFKEHVIETLTAQKFDKIYIEKVLANLETENKIMLQDIQAKLKKTNIILFKAMLPFNTNYNENNLEKYILNLKHNNVDLLHKNSEKITLIPEHNSHHRNIIEQESFILEELKKYNKNKETII